MWDGRAHSTNKEAKKKEKKGRAALPFPTGVAFDRAHGMNAFEYQATDDRFNKVFNEAMRHQSTIFMNKILEKYNGFEGVKSLVDVGGGTGASLKMIIAKHPSIKAINFDLPHDIIRDAPSLPGVEHIGGDMFVSVSKADAIFMKWICHDWSDSYCEKLLKKCYKALHENGKLIVAESLLPDDPRNGWVSRNGLGESWAVQMDVLMLAFNPGGRKGHKRNFMHWLQKPALTNSTSYVVLRVVNESNRAKHCQARLDT